MLDFVIPLSSSARLEKLIPHIERLFRVRVSVGPAAESSRWVHIEQAAEAQEGPRKAKVSLPPQPLLPRLILPRSIVH